MNMGPVTLPNHAVTIEDVAEVGDTSPENAIAKVRRLIDDGIQVDAIWCDARGGLIIVGDKGVTYHLTNTSCGSDSDATCAAAAIIEMAGLGSFVHIYQEISHGGETAHFYFER